MAWNQPGNNGQDRDPWGSSKPGGNSEGNGNKGGRDQGPPDLDDIFRKLSKKLGGLGGGKGTGSGGGSSSQGPRPQLGGRVVTIAAAAIVIIWAASPDDSLRQATDSALRGVIGKYTMDRILTEGRTVIRSDTQRELEETIRPYDMGITLLDVNFQAARPPEEVKAAFDDAIAARENEQQYIREAEAYTNEVQPRANGQAQRILEEARAYKAQTILEAQGEVARFAKLLPEYKAAPEITRERLYIETMEKVLGNTRKVLVNDKGGNLMVLPLDQMLKGGNAPAAKSDNGASNLLRLPPASSSTTSGASNTSSTSQGDIMDQRRANAQRNDYQRQGE